jgi:hypothetical protein
MLARCGQTTNLTWRASPIAGHLFEYDIKPLRNVDIFSRPSFEDGFLIFLPDDIVTVADDTVSLLWHEEHKYLVVYVRLAWSRIWHAGTSQGRGLNSYD